MAKYHGRLQALAINTPALTTANINMSGYLMETDLPLDQELGDVTVAGSVGHRWYPGLTKVSGTFKFIADDAVNASWNTFANFALLQQANPANTWSANYGPGGWTAGLPKILFNFLIKGVSVPVKVADALPPTMTVTWESDNGYTVSNW